LRNFHMDEKRRKNLIRRGAILQGIRRYFLREGFVEVETPCLVPSPGMEPHLSALEVLVTRPEGVREKKYLRTSPEYAMKKLLGDGWEKIFQVCKVFRDGEFGDTHEVEFTMLEWYRTGADYRKIMEDCETLLHFLSVEVLGRSELTYQGRRIDLSPPAQRMSVHQAMRTHGGVEIEKNLHGSALLEEAKSRGYRFDPGAAYSFDEVFFKIFLEAVEPRLGIPKPTILYDYPASMAALARLKPGNPAWAERFELYVCGLELANAFSELVDPLEQQRRFESEQRLRSALGRPVYPIDRELLRALSRMPPSAGIALGVDRLAMLFCDAAKIQDVMAFPLSG
jgi:elongation factor P--(R)-beta-lysine ligase